MQAVNIEYLCGRVVSERPSCGERERERERDVCVCVCDDDEESLSVMMVSK